MTSPFALHRLYRARLVHVASIKEPLVKAIYYYREAQRCEAGAGSFSSDPEARESFDFWMEEAEQAQDRCDAILADLRSTRELERAINVRVDPALPVSDELAVA